MAACRGARGCLHLAQQRVHLGLAEPPPGADRAVAGEPRHRGIQPRRERGRLAPFGEFVGEVGEERRRIRRPEGGGQGADQNRAGPERLDLQPQFGEGFGVRAEPRGVGLGRVRPPPG